MTLSQARKDPCGVTAGHSGYTVLLEESGHFVHCRDGRTTEEEPVSHERVVLQLPPEGPEQPYRYQLFDPAHPEAGSKNPLLARSLAALEAFEEALHDLINAPETLGETLQHLEAAGEPPAPSAAAKEPRGQAVPSLNVTGGRESPETLAAQAAQAKYLSYATPAFGDAVHFLRRDHHKIVRALEKVDQVCAASSGRVREGALRDRTAALCAKRPGATLLAELASFQGILETYVEARDGARTAVLDLALTPNSAVEQDAAARKAAQALTVAATQARALMASAQDAAAKVEAVTRDARFLSAALAIPANPNGPRLHLGRFSANGLFSAPDVYQVHVLRRPSRLVQAEELAAEDQATEEKASEREVLTDRFQPASRNYVDIGIAAMYSAGLPDHPGFPGPAGHQVLTRERTSGFNGGILLGLEPLQFTTLADPWAQLLHFPTVIIPFTVDPTRNFFLGAGVGLFDIASFDVGVHLAFTQVPVAGEFYGETFSNYPFDPAHHVQYGGLAGGYFVSLSLDVVGLTHFIVDQLTPTVRDVRSNAALSLAASK